MSNTKKRLKVACIVLSVIILLPIVFCLITFCVHRALLNSEQNLLNEPIGTLVEVNGRKMNVYSEGAGEYTLVFMSGSGTASPVLDFKSLYSVLSGTCRIAVVEKAGYGYSDDFNGARDIDSVLSETRRALTLAGITAPYVLCPHSMSGIEALYWAQQYPQEVSAIIGLDMSVPESYENLNINVSMMKFGAFAANAGLARLVPSFADGAAVTNGTLTEEEKQIYRAIFNRRPLSDAVIAEASEIKTSAKKVAAGGAVSVPVLAFCSNGSGGTGYAKEEWTGFQRNFISSLQNGELIVLDCPHYVHNFEFNLIAEKAKQFLVEI